jgi:SAM-dependent MidA family methyltransferase
MGSFDASTTGPGKKFLQLFQAEADATGAMPYAQFMQVALYHPEVGYYRRDHQRVGYGPGTDFFTASTSGPIFGELVTAACVNLLGPRRAGDFAFVEIGAEPKLNGPGVLSGVSHPFRDMRVIPVGEAIYLDGPCVVFSNELFDAQPFRRFVFRSGNWRELFVQLHEGRLTMVEREVADEVRSLPATSLEGYIIDAPFAARELARTIVSQPWQGLFVAFDYGKTWRELVEATPAGTARAYFHHSQSNDLLARPGEQDLTCHICWDWMVAELEAHGFGAPQLEFQESFLLHHAGEFIAATTAAEASRLSQKKLALMQLLHPAHLGQKFQVLHSIREGAPK